MANPKQIVFDTKSKAQILQNGLNFDADRRMWFKLYQIVNAGYWIDAIFEDVVIMHKIKR